MTGLEFLAWSRRSGSSQNSIRGFADGKSPVYRPLRAGQSDGSGTYGPRDDSVRVGLAPRGEVGLGRVERPPVTAHRR